MNQIISQHGWAFDSNLWKELKKIYIKNKWIWQDGERGYFNKTLVSPKWINNNSNKGKNIIIISNKIDIWGREEIKIIKDKIREKLPDNCKIPIITYSIKDNDLCDKNKIFNSHDLNISFKSYLYHLDISKSNFKYKISRYGLCLLDEFI